jgi:hypothetical protein
LGQVNSIYYSTVFYGGAPLSRLGRCVDGLLSSYASSGRSFGFFPRAFNNDVYFEASSLDSSGVFFRSNNPFGTPLACSPSCF